MVALHHTRTSHLQGLHESRGYTINNTDDASRPLTILLNSAQITPTPTSSTAAAAATSAIPTTLGYTGCNASNGISYTTSGQTFTRLRNLDRSLGADDLITGGIKAPTLDACIDQCANFSGNQCLGVAYHGQNEIDNESSCYLKSSSPSAATNLTVKTGPSSGVLS